MVMLDNMQLKQLDIGHSRSDLENGIF